MATKLLLLAACLALSHAALVKRDAQTPLEEAQKNAADFQKLLTDHLNTNNTKQLIEALEQFNAKLKRDSEERRRARVVLPQLVVAIVQVVAQETQMLAKGVGSKKEQTNQNLMPELQQALDNSLAQSLMNDFVRNLSNSDFASKFVKSQ